MEKGKFLSIIIPSYREPELQIYPLLASICCQTCVDFSTVEIIIMKDGGGNLYSEAFCKLFPVEIVEYALPERVGPGLVREAGIGVSAGEYLMFCDADDSLQNVTALQAIISTLETEQPDILRTEWFEEVVGSDGMVKYLHKSNENTWMHGKAFKRQFLVDNNIHFHPELRVHEDTYFLAVAAACTNKYYTLPVPTYLWKHNPESITRGNDHEYEFKSFPEFFKASGLAHDRIVKTRPDLMEYKVVQIACYCYFTIHSEKWLDPAVAIWREMVELNFKRYHEPTWSYFMDAPKDRVLKVYNEEREKYFKTGMEIESMGAWLFKIGLPAPQWMELRECVVISCA